MCVHANMFNRMVVRCLNTFPSFKNAVMNLDQRKLLQ